ncbi:unnamed protein product [Ectocarpus sp. 6 AP-2014]
MFKDNGVRDRRASHPLDQDLARYLDMCSTGGDGEYGQVPNFIHARYVH